MNIRLHFHKETRPEEIRFPSSHMAQLCEGQEQMLCPLNRCLVLCLLCHAACVRYICITAVEHVC